VGRWGRSNVVVIAAYIAIGIATAIVAEYAGMTSHSNPIYSVVGALLRVGLWPLFWIGRLREALFDF
jgi:hypothetical protein